MPPPSPPSPPDLAAARAAAALAAAEPPRDCPRCPRLVEQRRAVQRAFPDWWNAPIPALGDPLAWLVIIGLAPGKHGANRTGRAFTGDPAGDLLFDTLARFGLGRGGAEPRLDGAIIIDAVRCLPPANKPTASEIAACRPFLVDQLAALPCARVVVALGRVAHQSAVRVLGGAPSRAGFAHLAEHPMPGGRWLIDSYHCSRYNQNTGRLTPAMFDAVFARALARRDDG